MKRSEMFKIILAQLHGPDTNYPGHHDDALAMLYVIERAGMMPPGYMKPIPFESDGKQYPLVPGDFQNDEGVWCTPGVQEWEPEDNK